MSTFAAAAAVGLMTTAGVFSIGRNMKVQYPRLYVFCLRNALWLDASLLLLMLWKFGHSEFGASAATIACITTAIVCEVARRKLPRTIQ